MVGSGGGFPWGHMCPRLRKGVRGSTFLLVAGQEGGPSPGSSVDRAGASGRDRAQSLAGGVVGRLSTDVEAAG